MATDVLRLVLSFSSSSEESFGETKSRRRSKPAIAEALDVEALATAVARGDRGALDTIFVSLQGELWHFARSIVRDGDMAHDVVQDVFVDLWERRDDWSVRGPFRGYLFGAVRNRALHVIRGAAAYDRTTQRFAVIRDAGTTGTLPADQMIEETDLIAALRRAVDSLPERQRSAMLLRWNTELNSAEIGRVLGVSDTAARKLLAKGEAALRQVYDRLIRA